MVFKMIEDEVVLHLIIPKIKVTPKMKTKLKMILKLPFQGHQKQPWFILLFATIFFGFQTLLLFCLFESSCRAFISMVSNISLHNRNVTNATVNANTRALIKLIK